MSEAATEILFYHLENEPLERVLPSLLEKTLERGWRAVVKAGSQERLKAIDALLWTYREDSFLAHATSAEKMSEHQPILLTCDDDVPNGAGVMFLIDGGVAQSYEGFIRVVHLFDGLDREAVSTAREQWKRAKDSDYSCTYWQQDENGRWQKKG